ncbi:MAG: NAD+ synthase [Solirubrobacterales bacterium]|nr:MAG: NAD+ synthase [Solirubrobacterales bacterium]
MPEPLRIALCQMNPTVGDISGNEQKILDGIAAAVQAGAQLVLFGELAVTGYPPEDLLLKEHFLADARTAVQRIASETREIVALVGFPERADDVYNACAVLADGSVQAVYRKVFLPNYGVFDEQRYFQPGPGGAVLDLGELTVGLTVCEDIWEPGPPASDEALAGATLLVNVSASPYHAGKGSERELMLIQRARDNVAAVAFCNIVGGQDELVFDGHSLVIDHEGSVLARASQFTEQLLVATIDPAAARGVRLRDPRHRPAIRQAHPAVRLLARLDLPAASGRSRLPGSPVAGARVLGGPVAEPLERRAEVYAALVLGLRDYVRKNGFAHVVMGVSGGIDSALVAVIAIDALGAERVSAAVMPSPYSSPETQCDARRLAARLGIEVLELPIGDAMAAYESMLAGVFEATQPDLTEENLQARIRGNLLMALSNKFGWLVLTTGNKSELAVGYSTLYGDSAGGFAVLKDCPKTLVYELARYRNAVSGPVAGLPAGDAGAIPGPADHAGAIPGPPADHGGAIPQSIIDRAPSAELRPDQLDADSLPPYEILDPILDGYIEADLGREALTLRGFEPADIDRVITLVDRAEYKRRQAPPGIKISMRAFGRDRRVPITNRYGG